MSILDQQCLASLWPLSQGEYFAEWGGGEGRAGDERGTGGEEGAGGLGV